MKITGIYLPGNKEAHIKEWDIPDPKADEVLVQVKASALCASDLSIYHGNPLIPGYPPGTFIVGHEPCGVVSKVGPCVKNLKEGDRVAMIAFVGCGYCRYCRGGEPNLCVKDMEVLGFTMHGGDADYILIAERSCLLMPERMSFVTGAVATDAIGNLYSTMKAMNVCGDDVVAIAGLGPMGLSGVLSAVGMGATVLAIDPVEERLAKAKELGAQYTLNPNTTDPLEFVKNTFPGGVDKSVDCSASEKAINNLLDITRRHGIVSQIGEPGQRMIAINPSEQLIRKKLSYVGSWYFNLAEWEDIASFIVDKVGNDLAEGIVSHRYPLEEKAVGEAFQLFDASKTLKVVFTPND
ncbi:MAG TPA: alcohol dehydrogenase catalytic domain-containing protein [Atribacteraceae bacterium]|nr:alcohol dehydrogenase catalytic domain-containing protein [Atribacteraceae bacterium]